MVGLLLGDNIQILDGYLISPRTAWVVAPSSLACESASRKLG